MTQNTTKERLEAALDYLPKDGNDTDNPEVFQTIVEALQPC